MTVQFVQKTILTNNPHRHLSLGLSTDLSLLDYECLDSTDTRTTVLFPHGSPNALMAGLRKRVRTSSDEVATIHNVLENQKNSLQQRFSNFFQVGTTFISQNVLRTTLLLSALKANCLRFSTIVCDTQFTLILFFLSFLG
jgi:hypothetical protein